jgi:hypothetical protein
MDPAALRQYAGALRAGVVLRLHQPIAEKIKRHVLIAATGERSLAFIINSKPSPFIQRQPDLLRRQVLMTKADHSFMQHDSYIACHDIVRLDPIDRLAVGIANRTVERLGYIEQAVCELICVASEGSRLISPRDQKLIAAVFAYKSRK